MWRFLMSREGGFDGRICLGSRRLFAFIVLVFLRVDMGSVCILGRVGFAVNDLK